MMPLRFWILCLFCFIAFAVSGQEFEPGIVRLKVKPRFVEAIADSNLKDGRFGISEIDQLKSSLGIVKIQRLFRQAGKFEKAHRKFGLHLWYEVTFSGNIPVSTALQAYQKLEHFEIVEGKQRFYAVEPYESLPAGLNNSNSLTSSINDPLYPQQWHYKNTGQMSGTPGADISLEDAWSITTGSTDVIVAVIDGGVDVQHPDLAASMWVNTDEIAGNNIDDDHNGYIDDINGYGFGDNVGSMAAHQHGTHVAGTIAAVTNNNIGVAGIAGGSGSGNGVRLMSCAVFGALHNGGFEDAMIYAADNGAVISQNSWGGGSNAIEAAIDYFIARAGYDNTNANFHNNIQIGPMAGGIVTFAAGNDNSDDPNLGYPASYSPVIAVAATDRKDIKSSFSDYGSWIDVSAPGSAVLSTTPNSTYSLISGTSMACPHVSGVAALIISKYKGPTLVPQQVRARIELTADDLSSVNPSYVGLLGTGRVNALNALQPDDGLSPDAITDLTINQVKLQSVVLNWTATGASGATGRAMAYDIRYATSPITSLNFSSATQVTNLIRPALAGVAETLEVPGLNYGTTYYFAIRATNLFNHASNISNVASGTTLQPPVIDVNPTSLTESLLNGNSSLRYLTIENTGASMLELQVMPGVPEWLHPDADPVQISAGSSIQLSVGFDAGNLYGGSYTADIKIASNDPVNPVVTIPVTLTVTGIPNIEMQSDPVDFGDRYINYKSGLALTIHNAGTDILDISSILVSGVAFSTDATPFSLPPNKSATVNLLFNPVDEVAYTGTVTINSNDPDQPTIEIGLSGNGIPPPAIVVNPMTITASEEAGSSVTKTLTVTNPGESDLHWAINQSRLAAWIEINFLSGTITPGEELVLNVKLNANSLYGGEHLGQIIFNSDDPAIPILSIPVDLLVIGHPKIETDVALLDFGIVYVNQEIDSAITLINNGSDFLSVSAISAGDNFTIPFMPFSLAPKASKKLAIKFQSEQDNLFESEMKIFSNDEQNPVLSVTLKAKVILPPFIVSPLILNARIAPAKNGALKLNIENKTETLLQYSITTTYDPNNTTSGWLTLDNATGSIGALKALTITCNFAAPNLPGVYHANLKIVSTNPDAQPVVIPVTLNVVNEPDIVISATEVSFPDTYVGHSGRRLVTISNVGSRTLHVNQVACDNGLYSVTAESLLVNPDNSVGFYVIFNPIVTGSSAASIILHSDDPDEGVVVIPISGIAHELPSLNVNADNQNISLRKKDEKNIFISLSNPGNESIRWQCKGIPEWVLISADTGTLSVGETKLLTLNIKGEKLSERINSFTLLFGYGHPDNISVALPIVVTRIANQAPKLISNIEDQILTVSSSPLNFDLDLNFSDPDGDSLTYTYSADNETIGTFVLNANNLTFKPEAAGIVNVIVTSADDSKSKASMFFRINVSTITEIDPHENVRDFRSYPNPFSKFVHFTYYLTTPSTVSLIVTDVNGRLINELLNEKQSIGLKDVFYEDESSTSGFYFYHLIIDGRMSANGKMLKN
jgi:subtilisin family serine protease